MIFLDDYFESIEYVPIELRQGFTSIRELDLQVHNAMDALDKGFKEFFDKIHTLTAQQKQEQYNSLLAKCDEVMSAGSDKVKVADSLHELIEKCRRHLDIGLEKLREDLKEGDKADIVEELERRLKEEDELYQKQQQQMIQQQQQLLQKHKLQNNNNSQSKFYPSSSPSSGCKDKKQGSISRANQQQPQQLQRQLLQKHKLHNSQSQFYPSPSPSSACKDKSQSSISRANQQQPQQLQRQLLQKHKLHNSHGQFYPSSSPSSGCKEKKQGSISRANQQQISLISAITAVSAVSPTPSYSDNKINMISSNPNGDNMTTTTTGNITATNNTSPSSFNQSHTSTVTSNQTFHENLQQAQQAAYITANPTAATNTFEYNNHQSGHGLLTTTGSSLPMGNRKPSPASSSAVGAGETCRTSGDQFYAPNLLQTCPSSSAVGAGQQHLHHHRHDPIVAAASQAINATQQMQQGRRTSSLKASYAAVNSGSLQNVTGEMLLSSPGQQQQQTNDGSNSNNLNSNPSSLSIFNPHNPFNQPNNQDYANDQQAYMVNNTIIHGQNNFKTSTNNRVPPLHISLKGSRAIKKLKQQQTHQQPNQQISPNGGVYNFVDEIEGDHPTHSGMFPVMSPRTPDINISTTAMTAGSNHHLTTTPFGSIKQPLQPGMSLSFIPGDNTNQHMIQQLQQSTGVSIGGTPMPTQEVFCYCRRLILGADMIGCDNPNCPVEWFHYGCVGITTPPEGKWYCDTCKADPSCRSQ